MQATTPFPLNNIYPLLLFLNIYFSALIAKKSIAIIGYNPSRNSIIGYGIDWFLKTNLSPTSSDNPQRSPRQRERIPQQELKARYN